MSKSQIYLSQCIEAASKSQMCFTLGAVLVKGGKIISTGYNHRRTHYDGGELNNQGPRKVCQGLPHQFPPRVYHFYTDHESQPMSMHAEMHAIYKCTGLTPSFKTQVQACQRRHTPLKQRQSRKLFKRQPVARALSLSMSHRHVCA